MENGKRICLMVAVCSALHLLVDGLCICSLYLMASSFPTTRLVGTFLVYNVLAFLTQPLTGTWADRMKQRHWMLLAAIILLTTAVLATAVFVSFGLSTAGVSLVAVLLGAGNSLFHVWGGKQVAVNTGNDMRAVGAFVSTGVMGLSVGFLFFSWTMLYVCLLAICLLAVTYLHCEAVGDNSRAEKVKTTFSPAVVWLSVLALMAIVMLRSFVGEGFSSGVAKSSTIVMAVGATSMLGKMAGGWIARCYGIIKTLAGLAVVIAACLLVRDAGMAVLLIGLFAVNCTMPVTLYLANVVLPDREGLAFGLLAAALIPGYLLAYM